MDIWVWIVVGVVVAALTTLIKQGEISQRKKAIEERLRLIRDFSATQKFLGVDGGCGIAIDEKRKKVCILDVGPKTAIGLVYEYKDLLSSEIFEDGSTVTKTSRSSQLGGALIGGLMLGGVGALLGGLSGKTHTSGRVRFVDLRLTVNSTSKPVHDVRFLDVESKRDSSAYKEAIKQARHWHALITVLIKRADSEDQESGAQQPLLQQQHPQLQANHSIADELKKLAELRDAGVLTADEFQQQKARLLAS